MKIEFLKKQPTLTTGKEEIKREDKQKTSSKLISIITINVEGLSLQRKDRDIQMRPSGVLSTSNALKI